MQNRQIPTSPRDVQTTKANKPLFQLGQVVATPSVIAHLEEHTIYPAALLSRHQHGDWGIVDGEDAKANEEAVRSGARILSSYSVEYVVIWIITEAVGDDGNRASSCLLFPGEY
jgi:hypothetical protein